MSDYVSGRQRRALLLIEARALGITAEELKDRRVRERMEAAEAKDQAAWGATA